MKDLPAPLHLCPSGSSVLDYRRAAKGRSASHDFHWTTAFVRMLKIVGVFSPVSLFWGYWTNREIMRFLLFGSSGLTFTRHDALVLGGAIAGVATADSRNPITLIASRWSARAR